METKWTPGPWEPDLDDESIAYADIYEASGRKSFHVCSVTAIPNGEHVANAHLIAAAPELYEALAKMVTAVVEHEVTGEVMPSAMMEVQMALRALRKARGE